MPATGDVMPAGIGHKTLVFLGFMLLALGLVGCGDPVPTPTPSPTYTPGYYYGIPNYAALVEARLAAEPVPTPTWTFRGEGEVPTRVPMEESIRYHPPYE